MPRIEEQVHIDVPPRDVFDYLASPENHLEIMPSLIAIENVETLPGGGTAGDFAFKMLGVTLDGHFRDVTYDPPSRREYEMTGDVEGRMTYIIEDERGGARVQLINDGETPGPAVLEKFTAPLATRYLRREMASMGENLQMVVQETAAGVPP